ncbi:MAG: chordopoxvirus fusion protein, partial [Calditrichaeota bacterium]
EQRLEALTIRVDKLAEAQERTEQRLNQLAEAQEHTEQRLNQLAEAQERTEQRLNQLAEAQERTEQRLNQLAEAQERTELELSKLTQEVRKLVKDHAETKRRLGGLSDTVGYTLEDRSYLTLPRLLKKDFGIELKEGLTRKYLLDNKGEHIEVNIVGKGTQNGKEVLIVGESKSRLSKNGVNDFIRKKLKRLEGTHENLFPVLITYMISQWDVEEYARSKGIAVYYSYQLLPLILE